MKKTTKINHFGIWLKNTPTIQISRDNYAVIDKRSSIWSPKIAELRKKAYTTPEDRKRHYDDEECRIYSDTWCEQWREKCLLNFDLNMAFFEKLDKEDFEAALLKLIKSNKKIREVFDLNDCKGLSGIYVMVLDKYKQMYIGQAKDIRARIMRHWSYKKEFDRLLWGGVESSVLSIDCFGALDTTRIFILEQSLHSLNSIEKFAVSKVPDIYKLNRVGGGQITDALSVLSTLNCRSLNL